jgi:predicted ester cyclase
MRKIGQIFKFLIPVIALVALVVFMTGAGRRERAREEQIRANVRRVMEAWNTGNFDVFDEVYGPDFVWHESPYPDIAGLEAYKQFAAAVIAAYPDWHMTPHEIVVEGNTHAAPWTARATHTGKSPIYPFPPTGKQVTFTVCCYGHWEDGKMVEQWEYADTLGVMQQLGFKLVPAE